MENHVNGILDVLVQETVFKFKFKYVQVLRVCKPKVKFIIGIKIR